MGIKKATNSSLASQPTEVVENEVSIGNVEEVREQYDLTAIREQAKQELIASGKIEQLTATISLEDNNTILEFGRKPAEEMAKVADQVLSKYDLNQVNGTTTLVDSLLAVMKKIDITEIQSAKDLMEDRQKKTFFDKFKESAKNKLDRLVNKYRTIGTEMETICTQLKVYEDNIKASNKDIAKMYDNAILNYKQLQEYVIAGEQAVIEIEEYRVSLEKQFAETGDENLQFDIQNLAQQLTLMDQRVADLRGAESVALQSIPTFKIQEYTNANLARKINSAFIITVPAFKTALINSVISKQQSLTAQGLSALDEATSQLIRKNADNAVGQLKLSQKLANSSSIKVEDIEYSWGKLMDGIKQYKEMEVQYKNVRAEEAKRITQVNNSYLDMVASGKAL